MKPHPTPPKGGEKRESLSPSPSPRRGEPENEDLLDAVETKLDVK